MSPTQEADAPSQGRYLKHRLVGMQGKKSDRHLRLPLAQIYTESARLTTDEDHKANDIM